MRVTVPGISQAAFAALIGRAEDPELHSLVKHGASYRFTMSAVDLFGLADLPPADQRARMRRYFARDGVTQQLEEDVALLFKPASLELSLQGGACIV